MLLLESGGAGPGPADDLAAAECLSPDNHHAPHIAVARRLGGTSNLWGGRCVPFDAVDFRSRPWLGLAAWPIAADDLAPRLAAGLRRPRCWRPGLHAALPGVTADDAFGFEALERWSNVPRIQILHGAALARTPDLLVALGATATGFAL